MVKITCHPLQTESQHQSILISQYSLSALMSGKKGSQGDQKSDYPVRIWGILQWVEGKGGDSRSSGDKRGSQVLRQVLRRPVTSAKLRRWREKKEITSHTATQRHWNCRSMFHTGVPFSWWCSGRCWKGSCSVGRTQPSAEKRIQPKIWLLGELRNRWYSVAHGAWLASTTHFS